MRSSLFQVNGMKKEPLILPEAQGTTATLTEKVFVPVKEHPDVSTILRIPFLISLFQGFRLTLSLCNDYEYLILDLTL